MKPLPVPYRSNPGAFKVMGSPKVINAYAEAGGEDNKANFSLLPVGGIKNFGSEVGSGCRGLMYLEKEKLLYAVQGAQAYEVQSDGTSTALGFVASTGPVYMARNDAAQQDLVIVGDKKAFVIKDGEFTLNNYTETNVDSDGVETISVLNFVGVTYVGGYFVFWLENGRFYVSDLQSTNLRDIQFATAEGDPDGLVVCHGSANTLYLFGKTTTEVWTITGGDFPLSRMGGAYFRFGCDAPHSVKDFNNGVAAIGSDNVVYQINGLQSTPFSTPEISRLIEAEEDKSVIVAFTHERGQNKFYTLQGTGWTREYNAATGFWHDRSDVLGRQWHCVHHAKAWNKDIFGDRVVGQLFEGDYTIYDDVAQKIAWGFDTQIIHDAPNGLSFDRLELDMETGDGESLSDDSEVMLRWSKNNGRTFSQRHLSLGKRGEYNKRVRTGSIGQCDEKGMIIGVRITDNSIRSLAGLYGDVKQVAR